MSRRITFQPPITILVPTVGTRTAFRYQMATDNTGRTNIGLLSGNPLGSTCQVTLVNADFGTTDIPAYSIIDIMSAPTAGVIVLNIDGTLLSGVGVPRTPGNDDFDVTAADIALEITDAINDAANSFAVNFIAYNGAESVRIETVLGGYATNSTAISSNTVSEISVSEFSGGGQTTGNTVLYLDDRELWPGKDWEVVEGNINLSAINFAAALTRLPLYSAVAVGPVITITGPTGYDPGVRFESICTGLVENFSLVPSTGKVTLNGQVFGGIGII